MKVKSNSFFLIKRIVLAMILAVANLFAIAQISYPDSLTKILSAQEDSLKVVTLLNTSFRYTELNKNDTALAYLLDALKIAEESNDDTRQFLSLNALANFYEDLRKLDLALDFALKAKKIAEKQGNKENLFNIVDLIGGFIYFNGGKYELSLEYGIELQKIAIEMKDEGKIAYAQMYMGDVYRVMKKFDSASIMYLEAEKRWRLLNDSSSLRTCLNSIALNYDSQDNYEMANIYYQQAMQVAERQGYSSLIALYSTRVAGSFLSMKKYDQALLYAERARKILNSTKDTKETVNLYYLLSEIYVAKGDYKNSYTFLSLHRQLKDSLAQKSTDVNMVALQDKYESEKVDKQFEIIRKESATQAKLRNLFIAVSALLIIIAVLIANRYRLKKKSEVLLNNKNIALTQTLAELEATQEQLIQSAKMASLGELTAGIAHEIQNPLNFVNNFSEINVELIDEMQNELNAGKTNEAIAISNDIKENQKKINHHGKRADTIVKGMLQHSRSSTGTKEPTDLNALIDEYLRLAYHGLRAKDKTFNATMKTEFDPSLGLVNIIPQDIGRVVLNLFTNGFYAVSEKSRQLNGEYEPTLFVSTKKMRDKLEINVKDNGLGISEKVLDKIFHPFFTTKPTGQGTGLGLSLSYDIIKAHGGELRVETKEGEYAAFVISLPV
jgi:signal transduction histidine kinase